MYLNLYHLCLYLYEHIYIYRYIDSFKKLFGINFLGWCNIPQNIQHISHATIPEQFVQSATDSGLFCVQVKER